MQHRIVVSEVSNAAIVEDLFRRKFMCAPPDVEHHVVVFHMDSWRRLTPLTYVHFRPFGDIALVGGACTDGDALRALPTDAKTAIIPENSCYLRALRWGFDRFGQRFDAIFGYCGDARALAVNLQAGFIQTPHPYLLVFWPKPLHENIQRALLAKANALGPF